MDAAENYSVGRWCVDASAALAAVERAGRLPIFVGGTGLYFKALTRGLAAVPPVPSQVRAAVRERLKREGIAALYAELSTRDEATARRLMPADRARVTRALEVVLATGRSLTDWHTQGMKPALDPQFAVKIFLDVNRAELYQRIDCRFDAMVASAASSINQIWFSPVVRSWKKRSGFSSLLKSPVPYRPHCASVFEGSAHVPA